MMLVWDIISYIPSTKLGLYFLIRTKQLELPVAVLILMGFMIFHTAKLYIVKLHELFASNKFMK